LVTLDDIKVCAVGVAGTFNWFLPELDLILKILVSAASLFYIILKCKQLIKNK